MKICVCTTPIRPIPTRYPPFGSMAIIQSLRQIGEDPIFFNIDYFRFSTKKIEEFFQENQFDVVGISAVVSTAYAYTKWLAALIRQISPNTKIVVGGNLAASAEILLRKCSVDICVVGDGEYIIQSLIKAISKYGKEKNNDVYAGVNGICFLDNDKNFKFTGFGEKPKADEIEFPDFSLLEQDTSLPYFMHDTLPIHGRTWEEAPDLPQLGHGKTATVIMAKGCVARCTFCHRWEKGYRARPVDLAITHIQELREKYGVSHLQIGDENFGADRRLTKELVSRLGELGVTWTVAGVRVRTVNQEDLIHWRQNGCLAAYFGIESGSSKILEVMEKNATVEENLEALRWVSASGISTIVQLVIGMPGETDETIAETIDFLKKVSEFSLDWSDKYPSELISINYAQALPGTPLYEWAREHRYIGKTLEEEERYLIEISDTDAYKEDHFINYTGLPLLKVLMWRPTILAEIDAYHAVQKGWCGNMSLFDVMFYYLGLIKVRAQSRLRRFIFRFSFIENVLKQHAMDKSKNDKQKNYLKDSGYFNINSNLKFAPLLLNPITKRFFYPIVAVAVAFWRGKGIIHALSLISENIWWSLRGSVRKEVDMPNKSLRKIIHLQKISSSDQAGADEMTPLRLGR